MLTLPGEAFASRMAASLLHSVHLEELVASSSDDYVAIAVDLAVNPKKLAHLKSRLLENLPHSPLSNSRDFTRDLESAFEVMHSRVEVGLPPDHIEVLRDKGELSSAKD